LTWALASPSGGARLAQGVINQRAAGSGREVLRLVGAGLAPNLAPTTRAAPVQMGEGGTREGHWPDGTRGSSWPAKAGGSLAIWRKG